MTLDLKITWAAEVALFYSYLKGKVNFRVDLSNRSTKVLSGVFGFHFDGDGSKELLIINLETDFDAGIDLPDTITKVLRAEIDLNASIVLPHWPTIFHEIGGLGYYTKQALEYVLDQQTAKNWVLGIVNSIISSNTARRTKTCYRFFTVFRIVLRMIISLPSIQALIRGRLT